jgi:ribosomal protein S18 acetylase RimI-like enzyme
LHLRDVVIREVRDDDEARACATMMATSEPWITLQRDFDASLAAVRDPNRETYVAVDDSGVVGFVILNMRGPFVGYIQSIAVRADRRGSGLGTRLIEFAEQRILREAPNVFICVSSFNDRARSLYERLGYEVVGELKDFIVRGHSEWLLRKSIGPLAEP